MQTPPPQLPGQVPLPPIPEDGPGTSAQPISDRGADYILVGTEDESHRVDRTAVNIVRHNGVIIGKFDSKTPPRIISMMRKIADRRKKKTPEVGYRDSDIDPDASPTYAHTYNLDEEQRIAPLFPRYSPDGVGLGYWNITKARVLLDEALKRLDSSDISQPIYDMAAARRRTSEVLYAVPQDLLSDSPPPPAPRREVFLPKKSDSLPPLPSGPGAKSQNQPAPRKTSEDYYGITEGCYTTADGFNVDVFTVPGSLGLTRVVIEEEPSEDSTPVMFDLHGFIDAALENNSRKFSRKAGGYISRVQRRSPSSIVAGPEKVKSPETQVSVMAPRAFESERDGPFTVLVKTADGSAQIKSVNDDALGPVFRASLGDDPSSPEIYCPPSPFELVVRLVNIVCTREGRRGPVQPVELGVHRDETWVALPICSSKLGYCVVPLKTDPCIAVTPSGPKDHELLETYFSLCGGLIDLAPEARTGLVVGEGTRNVNGVSFPLPKSLWEVSQCLLQAYVAIGRVPRKEINLLTLVQAGDNIPGPAIPLMSRPLTVRGLTSGVKMDFRAFGKEFRAAGKTPRDMFVNVLEELSTGGGVDLSSERCAPLPNFDSVIHSAIKGEIHNMSDIEEFAGGDPYSAAAIAFELLGQGFISTHPMASPYSACGETHEFRRGPIFDMNSGPLKLISPPPYTLTPHHTEIVSGRPEVTIVHQGIRIALTVQETSRGVMAKCSRGLPVHLVVQGSGTVGTMVRVLGYLVRFVKNPSLPGSTDCKHAFRTPKGNILYSTIGQSIIHLKKIKTGSLMFSSGGPSGASLVSNSDGEYKCLPESRLGQTGYVSVVQGERSSKSIYSYSDSGTSPDFVKSYKGSKPVSVGFNSWMWVLLMVSLFSGSVGGSVVTGIPNNVFGSHDTLYLTTTIGDVPAEAVLAKQHYRLDLSDVYLTRMNLTSFRDSISVEPIPPRIPVSSSLSTVIAMPSVMFRLSDVLETQGIRINPDLGCVDLVSTTDATVSITSDTGSFLRAEFDRALLFYQCPLSAVELKCASYYDPIQIDPDCLDLGTGATILKSFYDQITTDGEKISFKNSTDSSSDWEILFIHVVFEEIPRLEPLIEIDLRQPISKSHAVVVKSTEDDCPETFRFHNGECSVLLVDTYQLHPFHILLSRMHQHAREGLMDALGKPHIKHTLGRRDLFGSSSSDAEGPLNLLRGRTAQFASDATDTFVDMQSELDDVAKGSRNILQLDLDSNTILDGKINDLITANNQDLDDIEAEMNATEYSGRLRSNLTMKQMASGMSFSLWLLESLVSEIPMSGEYPTWLLGWDINRFFEGDLHPELGGMEPWSIRGCSGSHESCMAKGVHHQVLSFPDPTRGVYYLEGVVSSVYWRPVGGHFSIKEVTYLAPNFGFLNGSKCWNEPSPSVYPYFAELSQSKVFTITSPASPLVTMAMSGKFCPECDQDLISAIDEAIFGAGGDISRQQIGVVASDLFYTPPFIIATQASPQMHCIPAEDHSVNCVGCNCLFQSNFSSEMTFYSGFPNVSSVRHVVQPGTLIRLSPGSSAYSHQAGNVACPADKVITMSLPGAVESAITGFDINNFRKLRKVNIFSRDSVSVLHRIPLDPPTNRDLLPILNRTHADFSAYDTDRAKTESDITRLRADVKALKESIHVTGSDGSGGEGDNCGFSDILSDPKCFFKSLLHTLLHVLFIAGIVVLIAALGYLLWKARGCVSAAECCLPKSKPVQPLKPARGSGFGMSAFSPSLPQIEESKLPTVGHTSFLRGGEDL